MPADAESTIKQQLAGYIVPHTGRPLGSGGTTLEISEQASGWLLEIECGFPMERSRAALLAEIAGFADSLGLDSPIEVRISWKIAPHSVQPGVKALPGISNIVAIASGKGGVGKSTVTTNLALALVQEGARVGILDADIYGPSQPRILDLLGERPETRDGKMLEPLRSHGLAVMSIGFLVEDSQAVAWRGPMVTSALNQMLTQTNWGELDYLFVDMPPGTGDIQLTLAQKVPVSGAVIVTTPQDIALSDARKGLAMFQKLKLPVLGIVENMAVHVCSACGTAEHIFGAGGGAKLAEEFDLPILGSLPLVADIGTQTDAGRPTVVTNPDSAAAAGFRAVALRLAGELAASGRDYSHLFPNVTVEDKS